MAQIGETARISEIAKSLGVTPEYAQQYRRRLIDAGVVEQVRRGVVAFSIPYLHDYLRKENEINSMFIR